MFRFLLSRRWIGFALFVMVISGVCVQMGVWQIHRLQHRLDNNKVVTAHLRADPVRLDAVSELGTPVKKSDEWKRVTVTGTYDPEGEVVVKFKTRRSPGVEIVTPLVLADGTGVLINRGWMESDNNTQRPADIPPATQGEVTVTGWLRPDNGAGPQAVDPVDGQVRAISSRGIGKSVDYELHSGYLDLQEQVPAADGALEPEPSPERGQGPHFFYALQWWFFAGLAIVGWFWFAWAEAKERRKIARTSEPDPPESMPAD